MGGRGEGRGGGEEERREKRSVRGSHVMSISLKVVSIALVF